VTELEERVRALEGELSAASQKSDMRQVAALLGRLGSNLEAIGQRARGVDALRRSVALFEDLGGLRGLAESLNRLGGSISMENPDEARRFVSARWRLPARLTIPPKRLPASTISPSSTKWQAT
jgi:hypothetical protein